MKIHIIGAVGSGKTTLAKQLSQQLEIPIFELDNVIRKRFKTGDVKRTPEELQAHFGDILRKESWVIEGVQHYDWINPSFEQADIIVLLDMNYWLRVYRIIRRFIRQISRLEKANYRPTFRIFFDMFKWNKQYEKDKERLLSKLEIYQDKLIMVRKGKDIYDLKEKLAQG